jgi:UDP-4-keto-D-QuiNAc 4-reductase
LPRVLVTGASGFVGRALCGTLAHSGYTVRAAVRRAEQAPADVAEVVAVGEISATTDWERALAGVDFVIHAAARAHVLNDSDSNARQYIASNVEGTTRLAQVAAASAVRRFVFLSSIKVNGEESEGRPYRADDRPNPQGMYASSKLQAEQALHAIGAAGAMQTVIVRPPLVYGPGVRANFLNLLRWVDRGLPLPLASVRNRRSLVSIWNLCSLLGEVLQSGAAPGGTWLVCDAEAMSTPDLIRRIARAMGRSPRLLPVPVSVLRRLGALIGRQGEVARLCGSLVVDASATRELLRWSPPMSVDEALSRTVGWYLSETR